MPTDSTITTDWAGWLARWDAFQNSYFPHREDRYAAMVDALASGAGSSPRVLDLGCGPGSLSLRILDRLPGATVVALDNDPVLVALGREALRAHGARIKWVDADLTDPAWASHLPADGTFDAAVSATALHWLHSEHLSPLYRALTQLLHPGGIFLDGDHIAYGGHQVKIALLAAGIRTQELLPTQHPIEDWSSWWTAIEGESALAEAFAQRARRRHDHPPQTTAPSYTFHRDALLAAGFSEVGTLWQRLSDRVLVAIR